MEVALWTQAALWMQLVEAGRWRQLVVVVGAALWVQVVVALWWQLVECALWVMVVAEDWLAMPWLEGQLELSLLRG